MTALEISATSPQENQDIPANPPGKAAIVVDRAKFQHLQALEDAIDFRATRASSPCADCRGESAEGKCDEHATDLHLVEAYRRTADELNETMTAERQRARAAEAA